MTQNKIFWQVFMVALVGLYVAAIVIAIQGHVDHRTVRLAALIVFLHAVEVPLAFRMLQERRPDPLRLVVATLLFGLVWWIPARRGIFAV
jgi:hypothetical protein